MQTFKLSWTITPVPLDEDFTDGAMVTITDIAKPIAYGSTVWDIMVERLLLQAKETYQEQYEGIPAPWKLEVGCHE